MEWYLATNGRVIGPLTFEALVESAGDGQVGPEDYVWRPEAETWERADSIAELWAPSHPPEHSFPWRQAVVAGMAVSAALLAAIVGTAVGDFAFIAGQYKHDAGHARPIKRDCALDDYLAGKCR